MTSIALTLTPSALADAPSDASLLPLAPVAAPDLPPMAAEAALPGRVTLSHGPAAADFLAVPAPPLSQFVAVDTPTPVRLHRRAAWGERLFESAVGLLMLLSGAVCVYRLLWMGR